MRAETPIIVFDAQCVLCSAVWSGLVWSGLDWVGHGAG
jgi:predicted DCC family thiol-disulfide oxidoreductase YuxK